MDVADKCRAGVDRTVELTAAESVSCLSLVHYEKDHDHRVLWRPNVERPQCLRACAHVHLCESNYIDGMYCVCNVSFHLELHLAADVVHLLLGIRLLDWENIKQSRTHSCAAKGIRYFIYTHLRRAVSQTQYTRTHQHSHLSITSCRNPQGFDRTKRQQLSTRARQSCDNCFEMKHLLYYNAN